MKKVAEYYRQIHMDFHTSEHCPDVGADFDEAEFIAGLKAGHVDAINLFAYGHHGWCYFETDDPTLRHPNLQTDLLGRQIAACKKAGINALAYITIMWNDRIAREHPDWVIRNKDGSPHGKMLGHPHSPRPWGWDRLCYNSPYIDDVILPITREVLEKYDPAGIWYDITGEYPCWCDRCLAGMKERGLDPDNDDDCDKFATISYIGYLKKTSELIWSIKEDAFLYHNGDEENRAGRYDLYPYFSHYEIESLPTAFWGYDHFPNAARYYGGIGSTKPVGMTGKFHTSWGEFGGFKDGKALQYEVAHIAALGCLPCVGDQLHPSGKIDAETYRIVGEAYSYVEQLEPWLQGSQQVADIGILSPNAIVHKRQNETNKANMGLGMMLMERGYPHLFLDQTMDFAPFKLLILPDYVTLTAELAKKLQAYLQKGGKLIFSYQSGLDAKQKDFVLPELGLELLGPSPWDIEYVEVADAVAKDMVRSPFLMYHSGMHVKPQEGVEVLAHTQRPFFNRTFEHFCSHQNTPPQGRIAAPALVQNGNIAYFSQPIFSCYQQEGAKLHRTLFWNLLDRLYTEPLIECQGLPSAGRVILTRQPQHGRDVLHLFYGPPLQRGNVHVLEDFPELRSVKLSHRTAKPSSITVVGGSSGVAEAVDFDYEAGVARVHVPDFSMHIMLEIKYGD